MQDLILQNADHILTMDDQRQELRGADIRIRGGEIIELGQNLAIQGRGEIVDARGCVVTPGLVNTHHHLYQTLTRAVPKAQDALLFGWLQTLYPIWARFGPDEMRVSAMVGLAELALSGCTLSSDHLYLYPNGARLDDTIEAAHEVGIRLFATRGSMSIGESDGGLPPDDLVEKENDILKDCIRVIDRFHDRDPSALIRVGIAPCSPFSVSRDLMREAALLARDKSVHLHTHLAENQEDIDYSLEKFGCRPGQYAQDLGWVGPDVWHAHCVKLDASEQALFAETKTGVAHCPCSNCRLGSGIASIRQMRDRGVPVGLGVDGSASNDSSNLILEARQAMLLQRVAFGADAMSAREALELATRGGADILGRTECGRLAPGKRADLAIWDVSGLESAGSWDPAALLLAGPMTVKHLFVEGQQIIRDHAFAKLDLPGMVINIRERRLADAKLKQLTQRILDTQEEERSRVARELHDSISQILVGVRFSLELAGRRLNNGDKKGMENLTKGIDTINGAIQEVRRISRDLRPGMLDDLGLGPALKALLDEFSRRTGIQTDIKTVVFRNRLDQDSKIALYRIAQEALTNIERHSEATRVSLSLSGHKKGATLQIIDNGKGFSQNPNQKDSTSFEGLGLRNMMERIEQLDGTIQISSSGAGTTIEAIVPLSHLLPPENKTTEAIEYDLQK